MWLFSKMQIMLWTLLNMKQEGSVVTNTILILIKFTGHKKISMWTKQTFKQPPFSLVNYIDWTEQPTKAVPLKNIFTAPSYRRKYRKAHGLKKERLDDIFEIFTKEQLNTDIRQEYCFKVTYTILWKLIAFYQNFFFKRAYLTLSSPCFARYILISFSFYCCKAQTDTNFKVAANSPRQIAVKW